MNNIKEREQYTKTHHTEQGLAGRVADGILKGQRRLADSINQRAQRIERRRLKMILILLGLSFAAFCIWILVASVFGPE